MLKTSYTKTNSYKNFEGGKEVELEDLKPGDIFKVYNDKFYLVCEYSQPDKFHTSSFHIPCVSLDTFTLYHFENNIKVLKYNIDAFLNINEYGFFEDPFLTIY